MGKKICRGRLRHHFVTRPVRARSIAHAPRAIHSHVQRPPAALDTRPAPAVATRASGGGDPSSPHLPAYVLVSSRCAVRTPDHANPRREGPAPALSLCRLLGGGGFESIFARRELRLPASMTPRFARRGGCRGPSGKSRSTMTVLAAVLALACVPGAFAAPFADRRPSSRLRWTTASCRPHEAWSVVPPQIADQLGLTKCKPGTCRR